jgi:hypothetical protein
MFAATNLSSSAYELNSTTISDKFSNCPFTSSKKSVSNQTCDNICRNMLVLIQDKGGKVQIKDNATNRKSSKGSRPAAGGSRGERCGAPEGGHPMTSPHHTSLIVACLSRSTRRDGKPSF